jgi:putative PIN family toxin of toxin-antitoxin system
VIVVLDTNVLVSGILYSGPPSLILRAWRQGRLRLALTPPVLQEYAEVATRLGERFPEVDIMPIIHLVAVASDMYAPASLEHQVSADADDDMFVAAAIAAAADAIVSGDKHLLDVSGYKGIPVLTPRSFVERFLKG